jgi:hypothetical protein
MTRRAPRSDMPSRHHGSPVGRAFAVAALAWLLALASGWAAAAEPRTLPTNVAYAAGSLTPASGPLPLRPALVSSRLPSAAESLRGRDSEAVRRDECTLDARHPSVSRSHLGRSLEVVDGGALGRWRSLVVVVDCASTPPPDSAPRSGLVVDKVSATAWQPGRVQAGDLLLSWRRVALAAAGLAFDLDQVRVEEAPRGW